MRSIDLESVRWGLVIALLGVFMGVYLGIHFGKDEDKIKGYLKEKAAVSTFYDGEAGLKKAVDDGWKYQKRSHIHFQGLGALSVGLMLLISISWLKPSLKSLLSITTGTGAFFYPLFWYLVSFKTAEVGKSAAKESYALVAQFGAGLFLLSFLAILITFACYAIWKDERPNILSPLSE
jgi:hypothetical protein